MVAVAVVVAACQPPKKPPPPPPPPPPTPAVPSPPVSNADYPDFPDPFVLKDGGSGYLAASTNAAPAGGGFDRMPTVTATSTLASWEETDELLQGPKPNWVSASGQGGRWWAPAVWYKGQTDTHFLYYTARHSDGRQCIGGAVSLAATGADGPYTVEGTLFESNPVVCHPTQGSIDPSVFVESNGNAWLLWKNDGNSIGQQSYIWARRLGPDGGLLPGTSAVRLIGVSQAWEFGTGIHDSLVEGPSMVAAGGSLYLFYSGNNYLTSNYATGYAVCSAIATGACTKPQNGPILASGSNGRGPGGGEVFADHAGRLWLAYHAWNPSKPIPGGDRRFHISRLGFAGGKPSIGGSP
jgi:beta-xylosidase